MHYANVVFVSCSAEKKMCLGFPIPKLASPAPLEPEVLSLEAVAGFYLK